VLNFDIDAGELERLSTQFDSSYREIDLAYGRALRRTAGNVRRLSSTGLQSELGLRNATALRRRIKEFRMRKGGGQSVQMWFGANDLPISAFKGRPRAVPGGVEFNGTTVLGAFFAKPGGKKRGVYVRKGPDRIPIIEAMMPVDDRMMIFLEDEVFVDIEGLFFRNFESEIRARTILGVGGKYSK
jgi:hypothetical protein